MLPGRLLVAAAWLTATIAARPNILLIVADDLGFNDVSWHNHHIFTPHLEKLGMNAPTLKNWV